MEILSSYGIIISASIIIILSYFFNALAEKTKIPSVLLLISLGMIIKFSLDNTGNGDINFFPVLEILGIVGLIMIVLEAALDLKLKKDKFPIIWKSLLISSVLLAVTAMGIAGIFIVYLDTDLFLALLYAIPISIMSSAIIIPSVSSLDEEKKEFMIYEGTFSDIFGIMFFYFLLGTADAQSFGEAGIYVGGNIILTILVSILASALLIFLIQKLSSQVKLFFLISVLVLLYAIGKMFHLSSLLIILVFGLVLENRHLFIGKRLKKFVKEDALENVFKDFKLITLESSFVIRTFFFVIFGITISLSSLWNIKVIVVSLMVLALIYGLRWGIFRLVLKKDFITQVLIAPRGLITVLLFFGIPKEYQIAEFDSGILLFIILFSAIVMAYSLVKMNKTKPSDEIIRNENGEIEFTETE